MNIIFLDAGTIGKDITLTPLETLGNFSAYNTTSPDELHDRIKDADIIITNKVQIRQSEIDQAPRLKLICVTATGTNNIDTDYAREKGIIVNNVAGYSTESVVQTTFAGLLSLLNGIAYFDHYVKSAAYSQSPLFTHYGHTFSELSGKTFGIIGMGAIGKRIAQVATAFGAKVSYYSTSGNNNTGNFPRVSLQQLLTQSDIISIHAPLNKTTYNLISLPQLQQMKPSALIINAGRGGIINEADLACAIDQALIGGAVIDVYEQEPIPAQHPYLQIHNKHKLILTPHIAWSSIEARARVIQLTAKNIENFIHT